MGPARGRPESNPDRPPFGLAWMRRYLPHYVRAEPSRMHRELAADLRDFHRTRGARRVYTGPRGSAKTTWLAKGYALFCAVERVEPFVLLLSETGDQAKGYLAAVREELESNPRLAEDYPFSAGVGPVWQGSAVRTRGGVMLLARGAGGRILGRTHRASRPTLVIADDLNERRDAYSPTLRRRKWEWFARDVLNAGEPRTNFLVAGTAIHREAIAPRLKTNPAWAARSFRSVLRWPDRLDLWAEWERRLTNLADPDRLVRARAFYESNRAAMDGGAEVLWPDWEPLYDLMRLRAEIGPGAFDSEKQDTPGTDGAAEWPPDYFERPGLWFEDWPEDLVVRVQTLDPSKGVAAGPGDYQAHVLAGVARDGTLYLDAEIRREDVRAMVSRAIDLYAAWGASVLEAESNGTMGLLMPEFRRQLDERAGAGRPVLCNYRELHNTEPKLARVRRAGPYLSRGQLRVRNSPGGRMLVDQWRDVPGGEHDDGPDAAGTAIRRLELLVNGVE